MREMKSAYVCCLTVIAMCGAQPPAAWDPPASQPFSRCTAYANITNQGGCNSCCASAAATAVGARACMRDGWDTTISPLQLWDCTGGTCAGGVDMATFVQALTAEGAGVQYALVDTAVSCPASSVPPTADPNTAACSTRGVACQGRPSVAVGSHQESWSGTAGYAEVAARIRGEIWANGPVVAVVTFAPADFTRFAAWTSAADAAAPFAPTDAALAAGNGVWVRHCLAVYGWDAGGAWLVQNSFGKAWGAGGRARLTATLVGAQWYTVDLAPNPCSAPAACIIAVASSATTAAPPPQPAAFATTPPAADPPADAGPSGDTTVRTLVAIIIGLALALMLAVITVACARLPDSSSSSSQVVDFGGVASAPPYPFPPYNSYSPGRPNSGAC